MSDFYLVLDRIVCACAIVGAGWFWYWGWIKKGRWEAVKKSFLNLNWEGMLAGVIILGIWVFFTLFFIEGCLFY